LDSLHKYDDNDVWFNEEAGKEVIGYQLIISPSISLGAESHLTSQVATLPELGDLNRELSLLFGHSTGMPGELWILTKNPKFMERALASDQLTMVDVEDWLSLQYSRL
jgi:hypothetical protein